MTDGGWPNFQIGHFQSFARARGWTLKCRLQRQQRPLTHPADQSHLGLCIFNADLRKRQFAVWFWYGSTHLRVARNLEALTDLSALVPP